MKERLLDVWADLRDRQLWPVAALLLAALAAVPAVLVKPAEETPSRAATPTTAGNSDDPLAKQALVKAFDAKPLVQVSSLDQFASKDPFKPIQQLKAVASKAAPPATSGSPTSGQPGSAGGGGAGAPSPGRAPAPGGNTPSPAQPAPPKKYAYAVDLTFVDGKVTKHHKGFDRLGMLPSESSPLLVFLGVDSSGSQAAFLVDSSLTANGDGSCKPSDTSCATVYLEPGQQETFTGKDGHAYTLTIDQIRTVPVTKASTSARGSAAKASAGAPARRFLVPALVDLQIGGHQ